MEWRKEVVLKPLAHRYGRHDRISLWGSCFAQELQQHLYTRLYHASFSPFGIMYNPLSMAEGLGRLLAHRPELHLLEHEGTWHSLMHHGSYSGTTEDAARAQMLGAFEEAWHTLPDTRLWVFTFGTAYVYEWGESGTVVNNCHRLPAKYFHRRRLTVEEIVATWQPLLAELRARDAEVLFTVSPIPHYRDGAHESRLSKSTLLLAIDALQGEGIHYFPSYEIQLDELRDYRYFEEDMAHPTPQAVRYILSRFQDFALEPESDFDRRWAQLLRLAQHRPLTTDPLKIAAHYNTVAQKLATFADETSHPYVQELASQIDKYCR